EIGVDGVRRASTLGHRLDDGRRADPDVAGPEDAGSIGQECDRVGLEALILRRLDTLRARPDPVELGALADREQDAVARDRELGARGRLGPATTGRVGLA